MSQTTLCRPCETRRVTAVASQASINEDIEQRRRLLDKDGEKQRMIIANKTAQILKFTRYQLKHVPWPTPAPLLTKQTGFIKETYVAAEGGWHAFEDVLHKASLFAEDTFNKTAEAVSSLTLKATHLAEDAFHKTVDIASSVGEKTVEAATAVGHATAQAATAVGHATAEAATTIGQKTTEACVVAADLAQNVGHKTAEAATFVGHKTVDAAVAVKPMAVDLAHKTADVATEAATYVSHKTADAAAVVKPLAADIAAEAKCRLVHLKDEIVYQTTRAYVKAAMETERTRRMIDFDEQYAILNGLLASSLIRDLGFQFYRQSGQNFTYSFTLLEELERKWRQLPNHSLSANVNANKVALLIKNKFSPLPAKVAFVEPVTVQKAYTPAL